MPRDARRLPAYVPPGSAKSPSRKDKAVDHVKFIQAAAARRAAARTVAGIDRGESFIALLRRTAREVPGGTWDGEVTDSQTAVTVPGRR